jgi:hypothetical protein
MQLPSSQLQRGETFGLGPEPESFIPTNIFPRSSCDLIGLINVYNLVALVAPPNSGKTLVLEEVSNKLINVPGLQHEVLRLDAKQFLDQESIQRTKEELTEFARDYGSQGVVIVDHLDTLMTGGQNGVLDAARGEFADLIFNGDFGTGNNPSFIVAIQGKSPEADAPDSGPGPHILSELDSSQIYYLDEDLDQTTVKSLLLANLPDLDAKSVDHVVAQLDRQGELNWAAVRRIVEVQNSPDSTVAESTSFNVQPPPNYSAPKPTDREIKNNRRIGEATAQRIVKYYPPEIAVKFPPQL